METTRWPAGVEVSPRSSRICSTTAVDVITKPMPATNATGFGRPNAMPTPMSSPPQTMTCTAPRPKISRRSAHSRAGSISSPMTKRSITTPSSAMCRYGLRIREQAEAERAYGEAGGEITEHRSEAGTAKHRHSHNRGPEQGDHLYKIAGWSPQPYA